MQTGARPAAPSEAPRRGAGSQYFVAAGSRFGARWRLEQPLNTSAMFEVWRATALDGARVALKIPRDGCDAAAACRLLRDEHAWLVENDHPNILRPVALLDSHDATALVTEYVSGGDLVSLAGSSWRHWHRPLADVVSALAYLHERGVVHRDIKARNVLLDGVGGARLIDFASAARSGAAVPSGAVTAAHRAALSPASAATEEDVYALAVLIYELFTGRLPYGRAGARSDSSLPDALPPPAVAGVATLATLVSHTLASGRGRAVGNIFAYAKVMDLVGSDSSEQ